MIITKLNLDSNDVSEVSVEIDKDCKMKDLIESLKYLERAKCNNHLYINWDKHLFGKSLLEIL